MASSVIALFGGAEKGAFETAYYCTGLEELFEQLGQPPEESFGLFFAVQSLLYGQPLIYFRVRQEGVTTNDYLFGLHMLQDPYFPIKEIDALFLPGVGSEEILDEGCKLCRARQSRLIVKECDFYDFLTCYTRYNV